MNTAELVAKIADGAAAVRQKVQAKSIVDDIFKNILDAAASYGAGSVVLPGFGKFKAKATPEREGRNPANGEKIKIVQAVKEAHSFSSLAKSVKDLLNG